MLSLPRFSNDPESPYRPRKFIATWALIATMIEDAINAGVGGSGSSLLSAFIRNGWLTAQDKDAAIQEPGSPNLTVTLRDGARIVQDGVLIVVDGDTIISGAPENATSYLTLAHSLGEDEADIWEPTWHSTRPAPGTGILAKITTDGDAITAVSTSLADTDAIPEMPYLLALILSSGGGEGGTVYWDLLRRTSVDPTTIAQYIDEKIQEAMGGSGTNLLPAQVRDEVMVAAMSAQHMALVIDDDILDKVPSYHVLHVSPGRGGTGVFKFSNITDHDLTTMPYDEVNHLFGQVA